MSDAIKRPTTIEEIQYKYNNMMRAYDLFEKEEDPHRRELLKFNYQTQLNNYRDTCAIAVERLVETNPAALQEIELWKY